MRLIGKYMWLLLFLWGMSTACFGEATPSYAEREQWVLFPEDPVSAETAYDLIYLYPTLVSSADKPLMDRTDPKVAAKTKAFVKAQTSAFHCARVFAPYVRQLEYRRCARYLNAPPPLDMTEFQPGIEDTVAALRYYLRHCRQGRPFVLMGHSQGALDLYEALKRCPEISPENGFVIAYLPGLPRVTAEQIRQDFSGRRIVPATGARDLGVIAVWNTQNIMAVNPIFTIPGGYVINPLNWRTDSVPAPAALNSVSLFYDWKKPELPPTRKSGFCGAVCNPVKGALIVMLPGNSVYDGNAKMGEGVFHINDFWFFAGNVARNAVNRVSEWSRVYSDKRVNLPEKTQ